MATITYRRLDDSGDPVWGNSSVDFLTDTDAVGQTILTGLKLFQGEWWADRSDGLPLWQKMLGIGGTQRNLQAISLLIQQRILSRPFVTGIQNVQASFDSNTREFQFYCEVLTQFGTTVVVNNYPTPPSRALPRYTGYVPPPKVTPPTETPSGADMTLHQLIGDKNNINTVFTVDGVTTVPVNAHMLFRNGQKLVQNASHGYVLVGITVEFADAPHPDDTLEMYV